MHFEPEFANSNDGIPSTFLSRGSFIAKLQGCRGPLNLVSAPQVLPKLTVTEIVLPPFAFFLLSTTTVWRAVEALGITDPGDRQCWGRRQLMGPSTPPTGQAGRQAGSRGLRSVGSRDLQRNLCDGRTGCRPTWQ